VVLWALSPLPYWLADFVNAPLARLEALAQKKRNKKEIK
jgi:hypothetical protein